MNNNILENIFMFLAIVNLVGLLANKNFIAIVVFFACFVLIGYYTSNKLYIIGVSLILSNLINNKRYRREGFDDDDSYGKSGYDEDSGTEDSDSEDSDPEDSGAEDESTLNELKDIVNLSKNQTESFEDSEDQTFGKRIDYSTTLEEAYSNLQNILGNDGIKKLSNQTQKLLGQQKNLMSSLTQMAPVINNAQKTLKNFNLEGVSDLFNN